MECIEEYLSMFADRSPDKTAVIVKDEFTSYGRFWEYVRGFARYLAEICEVKRGECVVVKTTQTLSYAISYFSIHLCGGIFVPLEKNITDEKALEIIKETGANVYISLQRLMQEKMVWVSCKDVGRLGNEYFDASWSYQFPKMDDSADIMYTTGTTGKAKGVEVTHRVLLATAENYITGFAIKPDNVIAVPGPMNHVNALRKLYTSIMNGSAIVILNGMLSVKAFYHALDEQGVTSLCLPPAYCRMLWQVSGDKLAEYAGQIDFVECSTAPVMESDKETLRRQLPNSRLYNNYGLSECGAMVMYDFNQYRDKLQGCVGKPMVNSHVIIVDESRREITSSPEHMGLIANRGKINMKGYWKNPEITASVMQDGYVYTNDIGYFDEDGFLYVAGRKNDTINIGGLKVEPTEVEEKAFLYEGIQDCICVPIQDDIAGENLKLFVVMKPGYSLDIESVASFMRNELEDYKVPKVYEEIAEIPKNYVGKPDRNAFKNGKRKGE